MPADISVSPRCGRCGSALSWDDATVTDDTVISCPNCGERIGTYGDLKDAAAEAAANRVNEMLRDIFKTR